MNEFKENLKVSKKEVIINTMMSDLEVKINGIRNNRYLKNHEKLEEIDVLMDIMKFLSNYDENTKILNKELEKKRLTEKYKASKVQSKYNRTDKKREDNKIIKEFEGR